MGNVPLENLLVVLLLIAAWLFIGFGGRRRSWYRRRPTRPAAPPSDMRNPHNQLEAINVVEFETQKLLNAREARLLPVIETTLQTIGKGHRVMAQTSLGELIRPKATGASWQARQDAYASINSKRLDFAIIDRHGTLVCAVEYQGDGHHQNKAFLRDAVKREAIRKAGVAWIEVRPGDTPSQLRAEIRRQLGEPPTSNAADQPIS